MESASKLPLLIYFSESHLPFRRSNFLPALSPILPGLTKLLASSLLHSSHMRHAPPQDTCRPPGKWCILRSDLGLFPGPRNISQDSPSPRSLYILVLFSPYFSQHPQLSFPWLHCSFLLHFNAFSC